MRGKTVFILLLTGAACALSASCGGGSSTAGAAPAPTPSPITLTLASSSVEVLQDGTPAAVDVTVARPAGNDKSVTLSVTGLPSGLSDQIADPGTGDSGKITFTSQSAAAGTYPLTIKATDGATTATAGLSVVVAIVATVSMAVNTSEGENGILNDFMSTSFQPASWSDQFFVNNPGATTPLDALQSQHIRIQALEKDVPMTGPTTWDFTRLDGMVNPILSVADHSPEFQVAVAPAWMDDASGHLDMTNHLQDFANYCANLVRYYDTGGFDAGGQHYQSSSPYSITWWGIFNEPNLNGLTPTQYVQLYNAVVPAMLAVDANLKFVAVELSDFGTQAEQYIPPFVSGVTAPVDAVGTHFYSTCNQQDSDQQLFSTIPQFVNGVKYIYSQLATKFPTVPVWVTENNVNADYDKGGGISACNGTAFVLDQRGTSAFFAAWRPYFFSQLSRAGNQGLYHWDFNAGAQFGEVNGTTDQTYRSYWVDYWLERYFPTPPGSEILDLTATETSTVEVLATVRNDGTVVIMIANHAVQNSTDNNGAGAPRTVVVDLSQWGAFSSATLLTIDAGTDPVAGPKQEAVTPAAQMTVTLNGYGVAFLALTK
ncbi:MAG: hypothetical protein P8Z30_15080 [Acidobacteriota bacterium]